MCSLFLIFKNVFKFKFNFNFYFWPCHADCGILVPRPGTEPRAPAVKATNPNHWTAREFPRHNRLNKLWSSVNITFRCTREPNNSWLATLLWYSIYRGGLEPNARYLPGVFVLLKGSDRRQPARTASIRGKPRGPGHLVALCYSRPSLQVRSEGTAR